MCGSRPSIVRRGWDSRPVAGPRPSVVPSLRLGDDRARAPALVSRCHDAILARASRPIWRNTMSPDRHARTMLPIPDRPSPGLTTYDAKDPDTTFPPIEPLVPPAGAPNVLIVLLDDVGFGAASTFGGPVSDADGGSAGGRRSQVQPFPHHRALCADEGSAAVGTQPPLGRHGQHHRDRDLGSGQQLVAAEHEGPAGDDPEAQRVLDRPVREVPRGAGLAVVPDGAVRLLAVGRRWVRDVLRVHRWREQPVGSGAVRRHHPGRATGDTGAGLSPDRGPDGPGRRAGCGSRRP